MTFLKDKTVIKFLLTGVVNTLIGTAVMFLLYNVANCSYWVSSAANYIVGGTVSFFLNKYFTFECRKWDRMQVVKFVFGVLVCYFIGYGLAKPSVLFILKDCSVRLQENAAMAAGMCIYTILNYFVQRFFTFAVK